MGPERVALGDAGSGSTISCSLSAIAEPDSIARMRSRLSREEALSFLLTHIVVERQHAFEMDQTTLFEIMTMAATAESRVNQEEGAIPHEVIETIAAEFIQR